MTSSTFPSRPGRGSTAAARLGVERPRSDSVVVLSLDDPASLNAIGVDLAHELDATLLDLDTDPSVNVVVITGREPAFCSGMDLRALAAGEEIPLTFFDRVATLSKLTIAAVNGVAATGGFELALACTLRFAAEDAWFIDRHSELGLFPGAGMSARLPRLVPASTAIDISLSGRRVGAYEALSYGFVDRVLPRDGFLEAVCDAAEQIAAVDRDLAQKVVQTYQQARDLPLAEALAAEREANAEWHGDGARRRQAQAMFDASRRNDG